MCLALHPRHPPHRQLLLQQPIPSLPRQVTQHLQLRLPLLRHLLRLPLLRIHLNLNHPRRLQFLQHKIHQKLLLLRLLPQPHPLSSLHLQRLLPQPQLLPFPPNSQHPPRLLPQPFQLSNLLLPRLLLQLHQQLFLPNSLLLPKLLLLLPQQQPFLLNSLSLPRPPPLLLLLSLPQ